MVALASKASLVVLRYAAVVYYLLGATTSNLFVLGRVFTAAQGAASSDAVLAGSSSHEGTEISAGNFHAVDHSPVETAAFCLPERIAPVEGNVEKSSSSAVVESTVVKDDTEDAFSTTSNEAAAPIRTLDEETRGKLYDCDVQLVAYLETVETVNYTSFDELLVRFQDLEPYLRCYREIDQYYYGVYQENVVPRTAEEIRTRLTDALNAGSPTEWDEKARERFRKEIVPAPIEMYTVEDMDRNLRSGLSAALKEDKTTGGPAMKSTSSSSGDLANERKKVDASKVNATTRASNFMRRLLGGGGCKKRSLMPAGGEVLSDCSPVAKKPRFLEASSSKSWESRGGDGPARVSKTVILAFHLEDGTLRTGGMMTEKTKNFVKGEKLYARFDLQCSEAGDKKKNPSLKRDYSGLLCKSELWTLVHLLDAIASEVQVTTNTGEKATGMMIDDIWVTFRLTSSPRKFLLPEDETLEKIAILEDIHKLFDSAKLNMGLMVHAKKEKLESLPPPLDVLPRAYPSVEQKNLIHFIYPYDLSGSGAQARNLPPFVYIRNSILGERASRYVMDSAVVGTSMFDGLGDFPPHILGFEAKAYDISSPRTLNKEQVQERDATRAFPLDEFEEEQARQKSTTTMQEQEDAAMQQQQVATVYPPFHHFASGVRKESDPKCSVIFPEWRPFGHMLNSAKNWNQFAATEVCCREAERCASEHEKQILRGVKELKRQTLSGVDEVAVVPYKVRRSPRST
ncbi:unnamed protein product [Amoebophrya sp. A25]|nr:unnamed protein product [Amoebophrya sp. A25]|eukprot:GSA25T00017914001.1